MRYPVIALSHIVVGAVIFNIIVGFIFTIFSGRGVHGGLNYAVVVGNCGG